MSATNGPYPQRMHTALDTTDARGLAEFYRRLLGLRYRPGDEDPTEDVDWLVLVDDDGARQLAVQRQEQHVAPTWPTHEVPMQAHLDYAVADVDELERHRRRAEALGGRVLLDRTDSDEPLYVLADLAGHPFCLLVADG